MNSELMAKGMLMAWEQMGVRIVKWTDNVVYMTIPQMAKTLSHEPPMTGEQLAKRIQEILDELTGERIITVKYKIV